MEYKIKPEGGFGVISEEQDLELEKPEEKEEKYSDIYNKLLIELEVAIEGGNKGMINGAVENLKEFKENVKELEDSNITDGPTGLFNNRYLEKTLPKKMETTLNTRRQLEKDKERRRKGEEGELSILYIDIDDFSKINNKYSHAAGDEALKKFSEFLEENSRDTDISVRKGGEEFVLILPNTGNEGARKKAEDLLEGVKKIKFSFNPEKVMTISIGICSLTEETDAAELLTKADMAMYLSKRNGKDQATTHNKNTKTAFERFKKEEKNEKK